MYMNRSLFLGLVIVAFASVPFSAYAAYTTSQVVVGPQSNALCGTDVNGNAGSVVSYTTAGPYNAGTLSSVYSGPLPSGFLSNPTHYCFDPYEKWNSSHTDTSAGGAWYYYSAPYVAGHGTSCTAAGYINGSCIAASFTPISCTSGANACNQTNTGTLNPDGSCTASTPANPSGYGSACSSSANACGQTTSGSIMCNGSCSVSAAPANPSGYGSSCTVTSAANSCGMTNSNTGTIMCSGSCSVSAPAAPSESLCNQPPATPTFSYLYDGASPYAFLGTSANGYYAPGYQMSMRSVDPNGDNVALYYQLYNESTASYIIPGSWAGVWLASGGWFSFTNLQNLAPGAYDYRAMAEDPSGAESAWSAWQPITLVTPPVSASCSVSPASIYEGQSASWTASASGGNGSYTYSWTGTDGLTGSGSTASQPYSSAGAKSASVTVSSAGLQKTVACSNTLTVNSCNPTLIPPNPGTVDLGQQTSIGWSVPSACANSCIFSDGHSVSGNSGTYAVVPPAPTSGTTDTYALTCPANSSHVAQTQVTVRVPTATITATPARVQAGSATTISWTSTNVDSCSITRNGAAWAGHGNSDLVADTNRQVNGSSQDTISAQTVYVITCLNDSGTVSAQSTGKTVVNLIPSFQEF